MVVFGVIVIVVMLLLFCYRSRSWCCGCLLVGVVVCVPPVFVLSVLRSVAASPSWVLCVSSVLRKGQPPLTKLRLTPGIIFWSVNEALLRGQWGIPLSKDWSVYVIIQ